MNSGILGAMLAHLVSPVVFGFTVVTLAENSPIFRAYSKAVMTAYQEAVEGNLPMHFSYTGDLGGEEVENRISEAFDEAFHSTMCVYF